MLKRLLLLTSIVSILAGCSDQSSAPQQDEAAQPAAADTVAANQAEPAEPAQDFKVQRRLARYAKVTLDADLSHLSENQRQMIGYLIDASTIMDKLFWRQSFGDPTMLGDDITGMERKLAQINYGPWDRLDGDTPFIAGFGPKPPGAQFYLADMTDRQFERFRNNRKNSLYTYIVRDEKGKLKIVPYNRAHRKELSRAAALLRKASGLAEHQGFANYLMLRAKALLTDQYQASDMAWLDVKGNPIEVVIGPIETYEDQRYGAKAGYESYVLIKDMEWSDRLSRYAQFLPELQAGLPVDAAYKTEVPGTDSDLNAYDAVYYAGHSNAGSKTIAINLPNDEQVQLAKGTRRLQLKNVMAAKFEQILVPIADVLIAEDQRQHITFPAFFGNTMFHEVAHGLGIKNTINDRGTVREALKELASPTEEGKADILGLYMISELFKRGEMPEGELMDHYVTFLAGIFRSVRFGVSSAHGRANMVRYNYFEEAGAFSRDAVTGHYRVEREAMARAIEALSRLLLTLQGDGDYQGTLALMNEKGSIRPQLGKDLRRLNRIPVDLVFQQGRKVLGIERIKKDSAAAAGR
ncbi:MAG: hypothetical protein DHS20C11_28180 [Lysobacteraceae bacterium]|nr:MAG: hypothetical protein DHS20C11_28180 [Xanthomonadaceae bacterium]